MTDKEDCFIIMPISTPEDMISAYEGDMKHFIHIFEHLFKPAINELGYEPIPPIAKGSDLIPAEIISNLETAELVLCDMSCLNPNVFFEFGIRTALNKPVSVVKDDLTTNVPFDASQINYHQYKNSLNPWEIEEEIKKLANHISESIKRSKGENYLWKYFGIKSKASPYEGATGIEDKIDLLAFQFEIFSDKLDEINVQSELIESLPHFLNTRYYKKNEDKFYQEINKINQYLDSELPLEISIKSIKYFENQIVVNYEGEITSEEKEKFRTDFWYKFKKNLVFKEFDVISKALNNPHFEL